MQDKNSDYLKDAATVQASGKPQLLGDVLAIGSRLVSEGKIPACVIDGNDGCYAVCRIAEDMDEVRPLRTRDSVTVGRASANTASEWHVDDKWMSKAHVRFSIDENGIPLVEDLESLNGTFVNDVRTTSRRILSRGDCIRAGHSVFIIL